MTLHIQLPEKGILSMWEWTAVKESISKNDTYFGNSVTSFTEAFEHELSFCRMCNFLKMRKELAYNSDIPHSSCLCEASEKTSLLAKRIIQVWNQVIYYLPLLTIWLKHTHAIRVQRIACLETVWNV